MTNSHKELVKEVLLWGEKMEFINKVEYITDINQADSTVNTIEPRGFVFSAVNMSLDDDYNSSITYGFTIVDKVVDDLDSVLTSEDENIFCVSALNDFINRIADGDIDFGSLDFSSVSTSSGVLTSISGTFIFNIKRTASYWKIMEKYDA